MPTSKTKLRTKSLLKVGVEKALSPAKSPVRDAKSPGPKQMDTASTKTLKELESEHKGLMEDVRQLRQEHKELLTRQDVELQSLELELGEKEALLTECLALDAEVGKDETTRKKQLTEKKSQTDLKMPYKLESIKKLGNLSGRLAKELTTVNKSYHDYNAVYVDEMNKMKILEEQIRIAFLEDSQRPMGGIFLRNKIKDLKEEVEGVSDQLQTIKDVIKNNVNEDFDKIDNKFGAEIKRLTEEKGELESAFLDKEAKLEELKAKEIQLDKEISARKIKLERQTEVNRKQIFNSIEFRDLMEHRDSLIARIDKSVEIMEDTKEAHDVAMMKSNDLYVNLLKNQKRVQELNANISELNADNEQERLRIIEASAMMDFVSQELNEKNGILLKMEVAVEELENNKEMLNNNLKHCEFQVENYKQKNEEIDKRIRELKEEHFKKTE